MGTNVRREPYRLVVHDFVGTELGAVIIADDDWGTYRAYCAVCEATARRPASIQAALTWVADHAHQAVPVCGG